MNVLVFCVSMLWMSVNAVAAPGFTLFWQRSVQKYAKGTLMIQTAYARDIYPQSVTILPSEQSDSRTPFYACSGLTFELRDEVSVFFRRLRKRWPAADSRGTHAEVMVATQIMARRAAALE